MKINMCIRNKKEGYASLEVIAMSLIGFTLVLSLLSIALNKRVLIQREIKAYEKRLNENDERNEFLEKRLSLINNKEENIESIFDILKDEKIKVLNINETLGILKHEEVILDNDKESLNKLSILELESEKFNLYLNEDKSSFILEERIEEGNIKTYYYDYEIRDKEIYLKERKSFNVK